MTKSYKTENFEEMSWHDNHLYGISWQSDFELGINDLSFDIDYISDWICNKEACSFKISPADLVFHDVTDVKMNIDWGKSGFQVSIDGGITILDIARERITDQKICLDRAYYKWTIKFATPLAPGNDSFISFGSTGFTQALRKEPILVDRQNLTLTERNL